MTTKTYVDFTAPAVDAAWLNDVDRLLYDILNNPADDAAVISGLGITSSIAELNILDGVTATAAELNVLDGITSTVTELNYVDGVTSAIQTQLDAKAALAGSASQAFAALAVNTAKTTVASATTPDIFAVTTGQLIDYTGTATATGFVAAPQAGMFRELYCADACLFTAGANLLIEGIPSGTTITLAAGALVQVRSITTTQFKMTYSLTGSFTARVSTADLTVQQTGTAQYSVMNGLVKLVLPALYGTSNSVNFDIRDLPACVTPATNNYIGASSCEFYNNSVAGIGMMKVFTTNMISVHKADFGGLTSSGNKGLLNTVSIIYPLR